MTWQGNPRTTTPQWRKLRLAILERDQRTCHVCHKGGADEVDHIDGDHTNNHPSNLAAIHDAPCHRQKSAREGARARWKVRRQRPPERHPGLR